MLQKAKRVNKKEAVIADIIQNSSMDIHVQRDAAGISQVLLRIHGRAAMLPSTTNSRMLWIPSRAGALKIANDWLNEPSSRNESTCRRLKAILDNMRASMGKNPVQLQQLEALTTLYRHRLGASDIHFDSSPTNRCMVLMLLSPDLNRHDSHNIPKAVCDWMADMNMFNNDRHIDAFARRKTDCGFPGQSSDIFIARYDKVGSHVDAIFSPMFQALNIVTGTTHPIQETLKL